MKYLMMIKHSESYRGDPVPQALMDAMGEFVAESFKSGVLKDTAGLKPTAEGFRVRLSKKRLTVTDGPFTESKELIAGYAILQFASKAEAIEWTKRFVEVDAPGRLGAESECEIRAFLEGSDCGA